MSLRQHKLIRPVVEVVLTAYRKLLVLSRHRLFRPIAGAALTAFCGLLLWATKPGDAWINASYDYLFRFMRNSVPNDVVLIQMDNHSYEICNQKRGLPWDRAMHGALLRQLAKDGCRMVVFDVLFDEEGDALKDEALISGLRDPRTVVLMAKLDKSVAQHNNSDVAGYVSAHTIMPVAKFLCATNINYGIAWLDKDPDFIVRRHWPFPAPGEMQSLAWSAAGLTGANLNAEPERQWLRYYGANGCWAVMNYVQATNAAAGYFKDKIVFIGNKPEDPDPAREEDDKFRTPYTLWSGEAVGGMEVQAAEFLNLANGDWLRRGPWWVEMATLVGLGILFGAGTCKMSLARACPLTLGTTALLSLVAIGLSYATNYWFPWLVVVGGQAPCALAWAWLTRVRASPQQPPPRPPPVIPRFPAKPPEADDYEILQPLGKGSFGQVWLARNAIGQYQALKTVYQATFGSNEKPYEREFNGISHYKPISYGHPGLLRIEFVSKKKPAGYFYYVMELGDALEPGWEQNPKTYRPKDLDKLLASTVNRRLPMRECLRIAIRLAEAVEYLHSQSLTHGDIKPQNIIFVAGQPKLADVGLVREMTNQTTTVTGTLPYIPPGEPPGTRQADIYALGMVLYVKFTGQNPEDFPAIPTMVFNEPKFKLLNSVILRACHPERARRYASASEMAQALKQVEIALSSESPIP